MSRADCKLPIDGILLVNKPQGLSSNAVLQKTKRLFKAKKAGHTGSLDPLATGMLPVCFGEATKISQYLLDADKLYQATGLLGIKTSTADAEGEIIATTEDFSVSEQELLAVIKEFIGPIHQVPSMFSALKHKGRPLYKLAREGVTIERKAREIVIHNIELQKFDGRHFVIEVSCSKGTYIRNLVEDLGERLGVYAHVTQLHRVCTAGFDKEPMFALEELESKTPEALLNCLLPLERAIDYIPVVKLVNDDVLCLKQGKQVQNMNYLNLSGCVRMHDEQSNFIGLGELDSHGLLKVKRLLAQE